jgi:Nickel responsive protein SCO4226-like
MKKFIVERDIAGLGTLSEEELQAITRKSNETLKGMNAEYHWVESFVTDNKMYCVHIAPDEATVREHARLGGFPVNRVVEVKSSINPTTTG